MSNLLLLIYPVILIAITFIGCKRYPRYEYAKSLPDRDQTKMLQAVACIGVIMHHVTQEITGFGWIYKGPITIMSSMGILFTSLFFFSSGYGLIVSEYGKDDYLKGFLRHRLPTVLVPFFIANIIYILVLSNFYGITFPTGETYKYVLGLILINGNGWYIVEIVILYMAFYILFRLIKNKDIALLLLCLCTVGLMILSYGSGHDSAFSLGSHWFKGEWWYNATTVFIMGMLIARFKDSVYAFAKKRYYVNLLVTSILFAIVFVVEENVLMTYGYYIDSISIDGINGKLLTFTAQSVLCVVFTWLIILINLKINIGNRCIRFLGAISIEVFLIHGLFLNHIAADMHLNDFVLYAVIIVCGVTAGAIIHVIDKFILRIIGNIGNPFSKAAALDERRTLLKEKRGRIGCAIIAIAVILSILIYVVWQMIILPKEFAVEKETIAKAAVGDEVQFGRFDTERYGIGKEQVNWIVVKKEADKVMLVSSKGLFGSSYNDEYTPVRWADSYLKNYLNTIVYDDIFSNSEQSIICANPDTQDLLSIMSADEAKEYFADDSDRQLDITSVAEEQGTNINTRSKVNYWDSKGYRSSWWWLRGDKADIVTPIVTVDGCISEDEKEITRPNGAVRPVVWVKVGD